jgi:hypothetical protein
VKNDPSVVQRVPSRNDLKAPRVKEPLSESKSFPFTDSSSRGSRPDRRIELDDDDRALLISSRSAELGTRAVVLRSGILDLLPARLEDSWQRFGIALEDNVIGTWHRETVPIIAKGGHKLWIIPGV